jgi:hypothetical protein
MNFRCATWKSLLVAGLMLGVYPAARAQSNGQQILFSSPDGQSISNALLPAAHAPAPQESANFPEGTAPAAIFSQPALNAAFPAPAPVIIPQDNSQSSGDERKPLRLPSTSQIMGVQSMEQIFGLPERDPANDPKGLLPWQNQATNSLIVSGKSSSDQPNWAKALSGDENDNSSDSNKTENSQGAFGGFFDTTKHHGFFDNEEKNANDVAFGQSQAPQTASQSQFDDPSSQLSPGTPAAELSSPASFLNPGLNSQSPFELPKSGTLQTLPTVPTAPTVTGKNYNSLQPTAPSWAPKPPPWLSPVQPLGTTPQRNF